MQEECNMNITVYLGAHEGNDPSYRKAVEELGRGSQATATVWYMAAPMKD